MDADVKTRLVEVKSRLWSANQEELAKWADKLLPLMKEETDRSALLLSFEDLIADALKEEHPKERLEERKEIMGVAATVKTETTADKSKTSGTSSGSVELVNHLRRDFKISGTIGDGPTCISYTSFIRQLEVGKKNGYSDIEILDGVIKAIQPGLRLRAYLEGRQELSLAKLQSVVRAAYKEKSATELYHELCALKQEGKENVQEFLFRAFEIKQKINFACKESDHLPSYDEKLIEHQFKHTISTGLRNEAIRTEALTVLKTYESDEKLIEEMNEIERRHQERYMKLNQRREIANVEVGQPELLKEIKALCVEVNELRTRRSEAETGARSGKFRKRQQCTSTSVCM